MTQINKARWSTNENSIHLGMEFSKVNKTKRLVHGWATLDNADTQDDIVTAEASAQAFARARGNLREMHKKDSAVGKIVSFKEDEFRAPDGQKYKGIFVTARVSEGAQDTWLKVLDGTLSGFSIGGNVIKSEKVLSKDGAKQITRVTEYDLGELSLVDNPANPFADVTRFEKNIFTIHKAADGSVTEITGMAAEQNILNVFFCDDDKIAQEKSDDNYLCPVCSENMVIIGFIEDEGPRDEKVSNIVTKFIETRDGGVKMSKKNTEEAIEKAAETNETVETGHDEGDPLEVPTPAVPADAPVEEVEVVEAPEVEELQDETEEVSKKIDELKTVVTESLEKTRSETVVQVEVLEGKIDDLSKAFDAKASEFEAKLAELDKNLETTKKKLVGFQKNLDSMNSAEAFRKSVDFELTEEVQKTGVWNGAFSIDTMLR